VCGLYQIEVSAERSFGLLESWGQSDEKDFDACKVTLCAGSIEGCEENRNAVISMEAEFLVDSGADTFFQAQPINYWK
jgi:hypothetical protein